MNNKVIAGVIALLIILGGAYFLTRSKTDSEVASTNTSAETAAEVRTENTSLKNLMASKSNQMCTFSSNEQNAQTSGTVFIASGKMRGDFSLKSDTTTSISHMIYDGTTAHVWMDGQTTGFKMKLDANQTVDAQNQSVDWDKNYQYDCDSWSPDNSKFNLPSGVTFSELPTVDLNASGSADVKARQQAACNNLAEPAKTQCLQYIK